MSDGDEIIYHLDPLNPDTDNDGATDGEELNADPPTNPLDPSSTPDVVDTDGDGLGDALEVIIGTNPYSADSDGDGLSDGDEVLILGRDPNNPDEDSNGVLDGDDDTDGDGISDAEELANGTNPLDPNDPPPTPVPAPVSVSAPAPQDGVSDDEDGPDDEEDGPDDEDGPGVAAVATVAAAPESSNRSTLSTAARGVIAAVALLLLGLILLLVGRRRYSHDSEEDQLALRKNASRDVPYDFSEDMTESSGHTGDNTKKWVHIEGEEDTLDGASEVDIEGAHAQANVHSCTSATCLTCAAATKEPVFVKVVDDDDDSAPSSEMKLGIDPDGDANGNLPPSDLQRQRGRVAGPTFDSAKLVSFAADAPSADPDAAKAVAAVAAVSFATGTLSQIDEKNNVGLRTREARDGESTIAAEEACGFCCDIYAPQRQQLHDDISTLSREDAGRVYDEGDTVEL